MTETIYILQLVSETNSARIVKEEFVFPQIIPSTFSFPYISHKWL